MPDVITTILRKIHTVETKVVRKSKTVKELYIPNSQSTGRKTRNFTPHFTLPGVKWTTTGKSTQNQIK